MYNSIIIRHSEIALKGKNRSWFEQLLHRNLRWKTSDSMKISLFRGRLIVYTDDKTEQTISSLAILPGIASLSPAIMLPVDTPWEDIVSASLSLADKAIKNGKTVFRVSCNRSWKSYPYNSMEIQKKLSSEILRARDGVFSVSMRDYNFNLEVEINDFGIFVFSERITGPGGLPVDSSGQALTLLSGGIDSPVAAYLSIVRGVRSHFIGFASPPHTTDTTTCKLKDLALVLKRFQPGKCKLFIVPFTEIQMLVKERCYESYRTIMYRRLMFKIAEIIAKKNKYKALVTGESIAQVASQTLENIQCIGDAVENMPVIQPLIAMDKEFIIKTAKKTGTYPVSIREAPDSCIVYPPSNPVTRGKIPRTLKEEEKLKPEMAQLLEKAISNVEIIEI